MLKGESERKEVGKPESQRRKNEQAVPIGFKATD